MGSFSGVAHLYIKALLGIQNAVFAALRNIFKKAHLLLTFAHFKKTKSDNAGKPKRYRQKKQNIHE